MLPNHDIIDSILVNTRQYTKYGYVWNRYYRIWKNICLEKLLRFEWKIATHDKTFTVAFLQTYTTDWQGHDLQENIGGWVKNHENIPPRTFSHKRYLLMKYNTCILREIWGWLLSSQKAVWLLTICYFISYIWMVSKYKEEKVV